jgi:hypothetical protein
MAYLPGLPNALTNSSYAELMLNGQIYVGSTAAAGVLVTAYNSTSPVWGVWNPLGSGVMMIPLHIKMGVATANVPAVSALGITWLANAGSEVGTGSQITAWTDAAPVNLKLGVGQPSRVRFTPSGATLATAPVHLMSIANSQQATTTAGNLQWVHDDFEGHLGIPPGNFVGIGGSAAPGQTWQVTMCWVEIPYTG